MTTQNKKDNVIKLKVSSKKKLTTFLSKNAKIYNIFDYIDLESKIDIFERLRGMAYRSKNSSYRKKLYKSLIKMSVQNCTAYSDLGDVHYRNGSYAKAEKYFRKALKYDPRSYYALSNLGICLTRFSELRKLEEALSYLLKAIEIKPHNFTVNYYLAYTYEILEKYDKAHFFYQKSLIIRPCTKIRSDILRRIKLCFDKL